MVMVDSAQNGQRSNQKSRLYLCCFPLSSSFIFSSLYYLLFLISFDTLLVTFFCFFFASYFFVFAALFVLRSLLRAFGYLSDD
jgi:hypothetical protein